MKLTTNITLAKIVSGLMLVASASLADAQVLYFQSFDSNGSLDNGTGDTVPVGNAYGTTTTPTNNELSLGWGLFTGSNAADGTYLAVNSGAVGAISDRTSPGGVTTASFNAPSNYTPQSTTHVNGFAIENLATVNPLLVTQQATLNPASYSNLTFNWYQGDGNNGNNNAASPTDSTRLVIQEGGNWYASTTAFSTASIGAAGFSALATQAAAQAGGYYMTYNYSNTASNWDQLTFVPGTSLSLGNVATSDLTGTITGFGFLGLGASSTTTAGNIRIDSFQISGAVVPEPSTWAMMAGGVLALILMARRNRRAQIV